uniref:Uncharacterized protein n=1 Tax=Setaria viridis TaxID=4556 RepID=A0A4U6UTB0_SETVI|nr:hypothetical protein SEVIR_4G036101v2 [Setaria viridis]
MGKTHQTALIPLIFLPYINHTLLSIDAPCRSYMSCSMGSRIRALCVQPGMSLRLARSNSPKQAITFGYGRGARAYEDLVDNHQVQKPRRAWIGDPIGASA